MFIVMPVLLHDRLSTLNRLFDCLSFWYDIITVKSKQIIRCALSDAFYGHPT